MHFFETSKLLLYHKVKIHCKLSYVIITREPCVQLLKIFVIIVTGIQGARLRKGMLENLSRIYSWLPW